MAASNLTEIYMLKKNLFDTQNNSATTLQGDILFLDFMFTNITYGSPFS